MGRVSLWSAASGSSPSLRPMPSAAASPSCSARRPARRRSSSGPAPARRTSSRSRSFTATRRASRPPRSGDPRGHPATSCSAPAARSPSRVRGNPEALPFLLVPCARNGRLLGVARLTPGSRGGFGARELEISARLGELAALALDRQRERESLGALELPGPATGLPGPEFLDEVGRTEVHKAHRFGRRLSLLCVDLEGFDPASDAPPFRRWCGVSGARCAPPTCCSRGRSPLLGAGHRHRLARRGRAEAPHRAAPSRRAARGGAAASPALGVANFPVDGESLEALANAAQRRVQEEHSSVVRALGIEPETPLSAIGARLLDRARWLPREFAGRPRSS